MQRRSNAKVFARRCTSSRRVPMTTHDDERNGSFLSRLKIGLSKPRELLFMNVEAVARGIGPVDETVLAELEEALILAAAGADLAAEGKGGRPGAAGGGG